MHTKPTYQNLCRFNKNALLDPENSKIFCALSNETAIISGKEQPSNPISLLRRKRKFSMNV